MKTRGVMLRTVSLLALLAGFLPASTGATTRIPQDDNEVLETLPSRRVPAESRAPLSLEQAIDEVQTLLQLAQVEGDPRYLGQAEALLEPWLDAPPRQLRLLHARLLQARHRFDEATHELDAVLRMQPGQVEAHLLLASIKQVRADYAGAREHCRRARTPETLLLAMACSAMIDGLNGHAHAAHRELKQLASMAHALSADQRAWLLLALGDLGDRMGLAAEAGAAYAAVADYSPDTLAAWCDWLLGQGRAGKVIELLQPKRRHDGLLLRLTRAESLLDPAAAVADRRELATRFAAAAHRGERTHLREEALFALHIEGDAVRALKLARANWAQQREPADARIWLDAARASGAHEDLAALGDWLRATGLEDRRLEIPLTVAATRSDVP